MMYVKIPGWISIQIRGCSPVGSSSLLPEEPQRQEGRRLAARAVTVPQRKKFCLVSARREVFEFLLLLLRSQDTDNNDWDITDTGILMGTDLFEYLLAAFEGQPWFEGRQVGHK